MPGEWRGTGGWHRHHEEGMNGPGSDSALESQVPSPPLPLWWDWVDVYGANPISERSLWPISPFSRAVTALKGQIMRCIF